MQWTDTKIEQLKELWEQGSVATEIAKELGTSRCSVLGKANRLKLTPRRRGCLSGTKQPSATPRYKPKEIPPSAIAEPENPTLFEEITDDMCKFPKWDKPNEPRLCCGRKVFKYYSYCAYHVYITTKRIDDKGI